MSYSDEAYLEKAESHSRTSEMDMKTLRNLVRQGEGEALEFKLKANHPEKIIREIVAFANTNGGILLVGIGDDKGISGLKFADEDEYVLVRAIEKYCFPAVQYQIERLPINDERDILVFTIPKSEKKPHYVKLETDTHPKAYVRVKDKSVQASKEVTKILRREKEEGLMFNFGEKEKKLMVYLAENQKISVDLFSKLAHIPRWLAAKTLILLVLTNVLKVLPDEQIDWYVLAK